MRAGRRAVAPLVFLTALAGCTDLLSDPVRYAAIEVRATRFSGEPVPGVALTLYHFDRTQDVAVTGPDGVHRFEFVRPYQGYGVWAEPPQGYTRIENVLGGPSTAAVDRIDVVEGDLAEVSFQYLKIGPGSIRVTLVEAGGPPLGDVWVEVYDPGGTVDGAATDAEGIVTFEGVPFGNKGVRAFPPPVYVDGTDPTVYRHGIVVEDGTRAEVDFALERCGGTVLAEVRDHLGAPVADATVDLHNAGGFVTSGLTDGAGRFAFTGVLCGRPHRVDLFPPYPHRRVPGPGSSYVDGLVVGNKGEAVAAFQLAEPCVGSIRVSVVGEADAPVPDAAVDLYTATDFINGGRTDAGGVLTFGDVMCEVGHGVAVYPPSGYSVTPGPGSSYVDGLNLAEGQQLQITFRLQTS